jgi:hypothetical protein
MNYAKITNIEFDDVNRNDHPDYCDAYILSADYNGREMTEDELEEINQDRTFVLEKLHSFSFS